MTRQTMEDGRRKIGKYIYGIINSATQESFDLDGIVALEDVHPVKQSELPIFDCRLPIENRKSQIANRSAYAISFQDISAIVSDSQIADYSHISKDTLAKLLVRHQQVIEKVMTKYTIIPMKLGTLANNSEEAKEILAKGYRTIKDIFERVKNTIEIDVVVTLNDFNSFLQEVSQQQEIKQLKQSLLSKEGGVTADDQMKVGVLVKEYLDKKIGKYADQILSALSEIAPDFRAHDLMNDKMVLNTAFLIDQNKCRLFEQEVERLNNNFEDRLNFRCVGPLPLYSFYTLEVKRAQFEEIDWARKKLGLTDDFITANEIKKAHRRLALSYHPDKNPNTPGIEKKFDDMTRAYRILLDYYRASNQTENADGCYLNEKAFEKNAILVTTTG